MRLRSTAGIGPGQAGRTTSVPRSRGLDGRASEEFARDRLSEEDRDAIAEYQRQTGLSFGDAAIALGKLDGDTLDPLLAEQTGLPLLAPKDTRIDPLVVAAFDPADPYAAKARAVRARLIATCSGRADTSRLRLAVLSADAGDEGAILAANLAVIFAQMDGQMLIVDVDIERPSLNRLFRMPNQVGLAEQLAGRAGLLPIARTAIDQLWLMTTGQASGSAISLVERGPLVDTANGWPLPDAAMLFYLAERSGEHTPFGSVLAGFDAVVIVARRGTTAVANMRRIIDDLDRNKVPIAGTVLA
ncbi:protein-tyrosine kinase [Sphingomonas sp. UYAg733]